MSDNLADWRSPDGVNNAQTLRVQFASGFRAISEFDRIGHLLLYRAGKAAPINTVEQIVGLALLRRAVTVFTGVRALLEQSLPDPARAIARAYFELWLNYRTLAYGAAPLIALETPTTSEDREPRARRYLVASERRGLRSRALMLGPQARFKPRTDDEHDALEQELLNEIDRLREDYPDEWLYFGDIKASSVVSHVASRNEPAWYAAEWPDGSVKSIRTLAAVFGHAWEYEYLYDAFSALVHSRGIGHDVTLENGTLTVHHPYDPTWFNMIAYLVLGWHLMSLMTAAKWNATAMIPQIQELHRRHAAGINSLVPNEIPPLLS